MNLSEADLVRLKNNRDGKRGHQSKSSAKRPERAGPSPKFKSKWEENFAAKLELEKRAGLIKQYWYEPFSLWLPGKVRYKPDFMVQYENSYPACGFLEIIEVKGWSKNRRDGITRLKVAAALFPCFVWRMVWRTQEGGWDGQNL